MIWIDIMFIIIIAAIISGILGLGFGWRHPSRPEAVGGSLVFIFLLLFLGMWASSRWFPPAGPVLLGFHWAIPLLVGLLLALIVLAIAVPPRRDRSAGVDTIQDEQDDVVAATVFGVFFWLLIIGLLAVIIGSYFV